MSLPTISRPLGAALAAGAFTVAGTLMSLPIVAHQTGHKTLTGSSKGDSLMSSVGSIGIAAGCFALAARAPGAGAALGASAIGALRSSGYMALSITAGQTAIALLTPEPQ